MQKRFFILTGFLFLIFLICFFICQIIKTPSNQGDWPLIYEKIPEVEFSGNLALIKNIRNFRYDEKENVISPDYYDKIYNLSKVKKVWFIFEPFGYAAHTFLSFEFEDNDYLTISIEARTQKHQKYEAFTGILRSYTLFYVVADERDAFLVRTNIRKNKMILFPSGLTKEQGSALLVDMLMEINDLKDNPKWYNTITANCTSVLARHINKFRPQSLPFSWELVFTGFVDDLAYNSGLIKTSLILRQAKTYYDVTEKSRKIGDNLDYSVLIRHGLE